MLSVTLGTSETVSSNVVLFHLSSTKNRLGTRLWYLLESFSSAPGGALCLQDHEARSPVMACLI